MVNVNTDKLQGDANVIEIGDMIVMIDAGYAREARKSLIPYLRNHKIREIDHFFISHPHLDHYQGIEEMLEDGVKIRNLYLKIPPRDICDREIPWGCNWEHLTSFVETIKNQTKTKIHYPKTGFSLQLPHGSKMEILHAQEGDLPDQKIDINDLSLIMKWTINGMTVLFTGDLNHKLGKLLASDPRMESTILKMPHHGGRSLAPNSFFERVDPDYAMVPGPKWIWCGERGTQAREWIAKKRLPVWVNGLNGHVTVSITENDTTISPERITDECSIAAYGKMTFSNSRN